MILSGKDIRSRLEAGKLTLQPFTSASLGESCIYLRLGTEVLQPKRDALRMSPGAHVPFNRLSLNIGEQLMLLPRQFVIADTLEILSIRDDVCGFVSGRSSLGREGLKVDAATALQPGFSGAVVLEIAHSGRVPIRLTVGMRIAMLYMQAIG